MVRMQTLKSLGPTNETIDFRGRSLTSGCTKMTKDKLTKQLLTVAIISSEMENKSNKEQHKEISLKSLDLNKYLIQKPTNINSLQQMDYQEIELFDNNKVTGSMIESIHLTGNKEDKETEFKTANHKKLISNPIINKQEGVLDVHQCIKICSRTIENEHTVIGNDIIVAEKRNDDINVDYSPCSTRTNNFGIHEQVSEQLSNLIDDKCNQTPNSKDILSKNCANGKTNFSRNLSISVDPISCFNDVQRNETKGIEETLNDKHVFPCTSKNGDFEECIAALLEDSTHPTIPAKKTCNYEDSDECSPNLNTTNKENSVSERFPDNKKASESSQIKDRSMSLLKSQSEKQFKIPRGINFKENYPNKESQIEKIDFSTEFASEKYYQKLLTQEKSKNGLAKCKSFEESLCCKQMFPFLGEVLSVQVIKQKHEKTFKNISFRSIAKCVSEKSLNCSKEEKTDIEPKMNSGTKENNTFVPANSTTEDLQEKNNKQFEFENISVVEEITTKKQEGQVNNAEVWQLKSASNLTKETNQTR